MSKALLTFAVGTDHKAMQSMTLPMMSAYAEQHGYDLLSAPPDDMMRPASWHKVPLMLAALDTYDLVLWLDTDIAIRDGRRDIADEMPDGAWQGITVHEIPRLGRVPNCGVWIVRRVMTPVLRELWGMTEYINHGWWEQAGLMQMMGYTDSAPYHLHQMTDLYRSTELLSDRWNAHNAAHQSLGTYFIHATNSRMDQRLDTIREAVGVAYA